MKNLSFFSVILSSIMATSCREANKTSTLKHMITKPFAVASAKAAVVAQLKTAMVSLDLETAILVQEKLKTQDVINQTRTQCKENIANLLEQHKQELLKASEDVKVMYKLHSELKEEEELQVKLETELTKLSQVLSLYKLKYEVVFGTLDLFHSRRQNNTHERCQEISKELASLKEQDVEIRAGLFLKNLHKIKKPKINKLDEEYIKNKVIFGKKTLEKTKSLLAYEGAKKLFESVKDQCFSKTENAKSLLETSQRGALDAKQSKELITDDLKKSREFSEAVRLEIRTGINFIEQLEKKLISIRRKTAGYNEDRKCYNSIKALD